MTPADLSRIETLAREATPGPWFHRQCGELGADGTERDWIADHPDRGQHHKIVVGRNSLHGGSPDYAYIAAANPAAVLALIARAPPSTSYMDGIEAAYVADEWLSEICLRQQPAVGLRVDHAVFGDGGSVLTAWLNETVLAQAIIVRDIGNFAVLTRLDFSGTKP
jgi:hypothetical protein